MADKIVEQPEVAVEEAEKDQKENTVEEDVETAEKADEESKENGAEKETNGKEATNGDSTPAVDEEDKCCIKRKSTGGETEEAKVEEVIPEKKAKLDDDASVEAESNGAEVAA